MTRWEVARSATGFGSKSDDDRLESLLADGWEPYAVTPSAAGYIYHLRRFGRVQS